VSADKLDTEIETETTAVARPPRQRSSCVRCPHERLSGLIHVCVLCRPHGHGDVHSLLHLSGTVKSWLSKGLEHMFIFQDTNFFAPSSGLVGLGVCTQGMFDMCSLCVPRIAGEAIGGICTLRGEGLPELTINVEYNQIDAMLRATEEYKDGDVNQPDTGFSLWPGNINELIFKLESYDKALDNSGGQVPEFVNPKYADAEKTQFKAPTRLECMMQDFPRLYSDHKMDVKVGFASLNRPAIRQYSPVKNNVVDAAKKQQGGLEPACASAGEFDVYRFNCEYLRPGGMEIGDDLDAEYLGIKVKIPPAVSLSSEFYMSRGTNVVGGSLAAGSTLICKGNGQIHLHNVHVEGTLVVEACEGATVTLENIKVVNDGWSFVALTEEELAAADEETAIRGFKIEKKAQKVRAAVLAI
jgi:UDP-sugar pyrophosphorylase